MELASNDDGIPGGVAGEGVDLMETGGLSEREPGVGAVGGPAGDHPFHRQWENGKTPVAVSHAAGEDVETRSESRSERGEYGLC